MQTDFIILEKKIRISGFVSEELKKYIDEYSIMRFYFSINELVNYISEKKLVIGYVGGEETKKSNPYEYIIYI